MAGDRTRLPQLTEVDGEVAISLARISVLESLGISNRNIGLSQGSLCSGRLTR